MRNSFFISGKNIGYHMKKKILIPILIILAVAAIVVFTRKSDTQKIGLVYIADAEAIDLAKIGLTEQLDSLGLKVEIEYANAFGEPKNINNIVNSFKQKKYQAILALTTPCAQIAQQQIKEQPIVFVGVSNPIAAGLVKTLDNGYENVTGTMSNDPVFINVKLAKMLFPEIKKIGIIYSANEANSQSIIQTLEDSIRVTNMPIILIKKIVNQTADVYPVLNSLVKDVDALFLINDNATSSTSELIINTADKANKPVFSCDIESVKKGALFTYGLNYKDEGIAAANILYEILIEKKKPADIPVFVNNKYYLYINKVLFEKYPISRKKIGSPFFEVD
ncbi:ABC transporter substrate-binding protein [Bacteroides heparinolyticus]|uniref:ABC transporter substrate-binding protein n=2 Tax=Prevotella heparinolytica TaxID=28113 RepID=A0A3P2A9D1_9BACE|nr:ABC transporter substrate-binding protein [Bacteroides heparinolyticus]